MPKMICTTKTSNQRRYWTYTNYYKLQIWSTLLSSWNIAGWDYIVNVVHHNSNVWTEVQTALGLSHAVIFINHQSTNALTGLHNRYHKLIPRRRFEIPSALKIKNCDCGCDAWIVVHIEFSTPEKIPFTSASGSG